jgi:diaminohydroxyphosphoribosylaminopyrimidine deaminase/5-amino-6-(5-phosphoribosylamino)uracil reductase
LVFGCGATQQAGGLHAEAEALREARQAGHELLGATAWVSLEPCAHFGRTPPCCDALIEARISRCVVAVADPNPAVAGRGIARMRAAGIEVDVLRATDPISRQAREVNVGFFSRMERARPWVRLKLATTLDGRSALADGRSRWITGEAARADGHAWRRRASAVLTGIGTVLADDPRLDVRAVATAHQPLRIVLDRRLRLPPSAALLKPPGQVLVVTTSSDPQARATVAESGAEIWDQAPSAGTQELADLLVRLAHRGVNELHIEAGPTLSGAFLEAALVDELLIYLAPALMGPGLPSLALGPLADLAALRRYDWLDVERVGADLRLRLERRPDLQALSADLTPAIHGSRYFL